MAVFFWLPPYSEKHNSVPPELKRCAGLSVAILRDISVGVFAELEQTVGIVVSVLLDRT